MRIIGIDPGSEISGVAVLEGQNVVFAANLANNVLLDQIAALSEAPNVFVAIESLSAYAGRTKPQIIDTAMWIGELRHRIRSEIFLEPVLIPRNSVKYWIYNTCPEICEPRVRKTMERSDKKRIKDGKKGLRNELGEMRKPSFNYVGDRDIIAAVKSILQLPKGRVGQKNIFGLKDDSWQALAVAVLHRHNLLQEMNGSDTDHHKAAPALKESFRTRNENTLFG